MDPKSVNGRPWAIQPKESATAYEAFITYLELGRGRSIPKAMDAAGAPAGNKRWWETWSSRHQWVERSRAYDSDHLQDRIAGRTEQRELGRQPLYDEIDDMVRELRDLSRGKMREGQKKFKLGRDGAPRMTMIELDGELVEVAIMEELVGPKVRAQILQHCLAIAGVMAPIRTEVTLPDGLGTALRDGLRAVDPRVLEVLAAALGVET